MKKKITTFILVMALAVCAMCGCPTNQENVKEPDIIQKMWINLTL